LRIGNPQATPMNVAICTAYGSPEVVEIREVERPTPARGEVLVRVRATTVTSADSRLRRADPALTRLVNGLLRPRRWARLGSTFSGEVVACGPGATRFSLGERVFGSTGMKLGAHAEYVCVQGAGAITRLPEQLGHEEGAALVFGGLASHFLLRRAGIQPGQRVLVYGASGSLGTAGVQLARAAGAVVHGVCSAANVALVQSLGAERVFDYARENFADDGERYDVVYDAVGKSDFTSCLRVLSPRGVYVRAVHMTPGPMLRGLWTGLTSKQRVLGGVASERLDDLQFLCDLAASGRLRAVIDRSYRFEQIVEAHRHVDSGRKRGEVVMTLG
jgi:NADPH:quinone reductase-like Zn-dependent oxidoreductase